MISDWPRPGVRVSWAAGRVGDDDIVGEHENELVTPASVMKVQVALTATTAIETGQLDGGARVSLRPEGRTAGPAGMSLMVDAVEMSVRDLLVPMLTISDNVAADALLGLVGLDAVNAMTAALRLADTVLVDALATMLDRAAGEVGFADYAHLARHDPRVGGPPTEDDVHQRLERTAALDRQRGTRTTPVDMIRLLRLIWTDAAGPAAACSRIQKLMRQQLTRQRIASGFGNGWTVAAKSGGLFGVVRNEIGVVTDIDGTSYALAIFTRREVGDDTEPAVIDAAIGALARRAVAELA